MTKIFDSELLRNSGSHSLQGEYVFSGTLRANVDEAWLDLDSDGTESLAILDQKFIENLFGVVPCYVGGEYLYRDSISFEGTLIKNKAGRAITNIKSARLTRKDEGDYEF